MVINIKGKTLVEIRYDKIESDKHYETENGYMRSGYIVCNKTEEGYRYGYINYNLKTLLPVEYNELNRVIEIGDKDNVYLIASKNGQVGIVKNNKPIVKFEYQKIEYGEENLFVVQKNLAYGAIDIEGNIIIPTEFEEIAFYGLYIKALRQEQDIYFDLKGKKIENAKYSAIIPTENAKYYITTNLEGKYGVLTNNEEILIKNDYEYVEYLFDEYFVVIKEKGKLGIINSNGETKIDFKYDILQKIENTKIIEAKILDGNITHLYSEEMKNIATTNNGTIYTFDEYVQVYSKDQIKYFTLEGKEIANTELFKDNKLFTKNENKKWGFINKQGDNVIDFKYDAVTEFNKYGFAGININGKWGVIDEKGNTVIEPIYEHIEYNSNPEFLGQYYKVYFGYGECYYTNNLND